MTLDLAKPQTSTSASSFRTKDAPINAAAHLKNPNPKGFFNLKKSLSSVTTGLEITAVKDFFRFNKEKLQSIGIRAQTFKPWLLIVTTLFDNQVEKDNW